MAKRDDVLAVLASANRDVYLAQLIWELTLRGRGWYRGVDLTVEAGAVGLPCVNELVLAVSERLQSLLVGAQVCSDEDFMSVLEGIAASPDCVGEFQMAAIGAMEFVNNRFGHAHGTDAETL